MSVRFGSYDTAWRQTSETPVDLRVCECCPTAAAVTSDGPIVAVPRPQRHGSPRHLRLPAGGRQVDRGRARARRQLVIPGCPVNGPSLSARGRNVAIAWFTVKEDVGQAFVAFSADAGRSFDAPVRVDDGGTLGRVDVDLLPDGAALATWIEFALGQRAQFRARRIARDGTRAASITVAGLGRHPRQWLSPGRPPRRHAGVRLDRLRRGDVAGAHGHDLARHTRFPLIGPDLRVGPVGADPVQIAAAVPAPRRRSLSEIRQPFAAGSVRRGTGPAAAAFSSATTGTCPAILAAVTRVLATLVAGLLALSPAPRSGMERRAGAHERCGTPTATAPCDCSMQALPCCGTAVPAPTAIAARAAGVAAPRVTASSGLGSNDRPIPRCQSWPRRHTSDGWPGALRPPTS